MLVNIYNFIVQVIATPLAILAFVVGGICIMVSGGNPGLSGLGKTIMKSATIGLVLVFLSFLIIDFTLHAIGYSGPSWSKLNLSCSSSSISSGGSSSPSSSNVYPSAGSGVSVTQPSGTTPGKVSDVSPGATASSIETDLTGNPPAQSFNSPNLKIYSGIIPYALADLTLQSGALIKIYHSDGITPLSESDPVVTGDKVIVTSGDGTVTSTYIINVNANASVTSGAYTLFQPSGETTGSISGVINGTSVSDFSANLKTPAGSTFVVVKSDGTTPETGPVVTGDEVIVTAQDGSKGTYVVSIASNDASITSSKYPVSSLSGGTSGTGTIHGVPAGISVSAFSSALTPANKATFAVYLYDGTTLETGPVATGDEVISTSEDKINTGTYTITVSENQSGPLTSTFYSITPPSGVPLPQLPLGSMPGKITDVTAGTSVNDFKNNITVSSTYTYNVYQKGSTTTLQPATDPIITGDNVILTAQDGTMAVYVVYLSVNSDTLLTSQYYDVSVILSSAGGTGTITNIPAGTLTSVLQTNLIPISGATLTIYKNDGTTPETGSVASGDKVIVIASDGTTTGTYTITVNPTSSAPLTSGVYSVTQPIGVGTVIGGGSITNVAAGTSISDFGSNIVIVPGYSYAIYQAGSGSTVHQATNPIISGDEVIVTATRWNVIRLYN